MNEVVSHAVKHAYSMSFRTVFMCTLSFGAIILVAAVISPNAQNYMMDDVARRLQERALRNQQMKEMRAPQANKYDT